MEQSVNIPEGKDLLTVQSPGQREVRIVDQAGHEVFRSAAQGGRVQAILPPGTYTVTTDGKALEVMVSAREERHRPPRHDAAHPPLPK